MLHNDISKANRDNTLCARLCACACVCLQSAGGRVASVFSALNHLNVITIEYCQPASREPRKECFYICP